ncbi:MAG: hypothetical protein PWP51_242 [Clostridiales bacterium]|jgi:hypothetical protein|nr:hypothetical protein [Clostridiales bacterium]MDN5297689.1 hypothetical protein [Clostridiales bacterium]
MFFVFGFGKQTIKTRWADEVRTCPRCGNTKRWPYKKITYWFTLFFIPILPYQVKYVTVCPICGYFETIDQAAFDAASEEADDSDKPVGVPPRTGMTEVQRRFNQEMATYENQKKDKTEQ